jgi:hypothetical protein
MPLAGGILAAPVGRSGLRQGRGRHQEQQNRQESHGLRNYPDQTPSPSIGEIPRYRVCYLQRMITRRTFLGTASAFALSERLFAAEPSSTKPSADLEKLGAVALSEAKRLKATYCDIRIQRMRGQTVGIFLNPERGTGKTLTVPTAVES